MNEGWAGALASGQVGNPLHYKRYAFPSLHFVSLSSLSVSFLHSLARIGSLIHSVIPLYLLSIFSFYSFLYRYVYTSLFIYRFVQSPSLHVPFHYTCSLRVSHYTYWKLLSYTPYTSFRSCFVSLHKCFAHYTNHFVRANKKKEHSYVHYYS